MGHGLCCLLIIVSVGSLVGCAGFQHSSILPVHVNAENAEAINSYLAERVAFATARDKGDFNTLIRLERSLAGEGENGVSLWNILSLLDIMESGYSWSVDQREPELGHGRKAEWDKCVVTLLWSRHPSVKHNTILWLMNHQYSTGEGTVDAVFTLCETEPSADVRSAGFHFLANYFGFTREGFYFSEESGLGSISFPLTQVRKYWEQHKADVIQYNKSLLYGYGWRGYRLERGINIGLKPSAEPEYIPSRNMGLNPRDYPVK